VAEACERERPHHRKRKVFSLTFLVGNDNRKKNFLKKDAITKGETLLFFKEEKSSNS
jgi:hypothetical protein